MRVDMTNSGELFITEDVRDEIEMEHRDIHDELRENGLYVRVEAHPDTQWVYSKAQDIDFPDEGRVVLKVFIGEDKSIVSDDDYVKVGEGKFSVKKEIRSGMGGRFVEAVVDSVLVVWDDEMLQALGVSL